MWCCDKRKKDSIPKGMTKVFSNTTRKCNTCELMISDYVYYQNCSSCYHVYHTYCNPKNSKCMVCKNC